MRDRRRARQLVRSGFLLDCDWPAYRALQAEMPDAEWQKYFDLDKYIMRNVERIFALDLQQGEKLNILDLGCGTGLFMAACREFGHRPFGINLADPLFDRTLEIFDLPWLEHRVTYDQPLPELSGGPFDLITGFETYFDKTDGKPWETRHWQAFFAGLKPQMHAKSRIYLKLNLLGPSELYNPVTPDVRRYFESLGARIRRRAIDFPAAYTEI